ncbi:RecA/RadA recombinase ['Chrysanthemum coronarium' phytoplasma]|uniref:Protein RecA n=1 Tax='Chrysanthemum coronarium' phytoplasma TaxID=1520703 RepID=A0ABQ0J2X9_9MOLU|nr:RecA/RadA recombinase ['Chrysanthemum coronarium' phytoplasma]
MVFGNPEVTPGFKALKFFASLCLDIRRAETLKQGDQVVGIRSKVKVVKSTISSPLKTATIDIIYDKVIAKMIEVIDLATNLNLIQKSGSWYSFKDEKIGQGTESVKKYLTNNPKIYNHLVAEIKKRYNISN